MTKYEAAVIQAYTGIAMLIGDDFPIFTKYCEDLLGHPIFTHEYPDFEEETKELSKPDFIKICKNLEE